MVIRPLYTVNDCRAASVEKAAQCGLVAESKKTGGGNGPSFDLELDLPTTPAPAGHPHPGAPAPAKKPQPARAAPLPQIGELDDWDADPIDEAPPPLSLADDEDRKPAAKQSQAAKPRLATAARPHHAHPEPQSALGVPDTEVAALAGYGDPPVTLFASVRYAIKVLRRRRELAGMLVRVTRDGDKEKRELQSRMAGLLDALLSRHADHEGLAQIARPITEATALIANRAEQLEVTKQQHQAQAGQLDLELKSRGNDAERLRGERHKAQILLEDANSRLARAAAEVSRVARELELAHEAAAAAAGDATFAPPEHARKIAALDAHKARAAEEKRAADQATGEAKSRVATLDRSLRDVDKSVQDIHARRRALERQALLQREAGAQGVQSAEHDRLDAYETALRAVVGLHPELLDEGQQTSFRELDAGLHRTAYELEKHQRAVGAYDKEALQRGVTVTVGTLLGIIVLLVAVTQIR
jgi:hypothetical protein